MCCCWGSLRQIQCEKCNIRLDRGRKIVISRDTGNATHTSAPLCVTLPLSSASEVVRGTSKPVLSQLVANPQAQLSAAPVCCIAPSYAPKRLSFSIACKVKFYHDSHRLQFRPVKYNFVAMKMTSACCLQEGSSTSSAMQRPG